MIRSILGLSTYLSRAPPTSSLPSSVIAWMLPMMSSISSSFSDRVLSVVPRMPSRLWMMPSTSSRLSVRILWIVSMTT